ncbi:hypothetical protein RO3G_08816 [Rhizopus delemar RA 99-880]|uniref:Uncharacterized protein n=3 Tax=Rhizopus TaxID=4842 RepID=I1C6M6_RHIO9|nr:hypothetical protein RO3G_08816 [Rhizopus delemar RA 99-880]|eukprot:EIE84106.1 hypothetical protein RO3G_08816 [Rhizopus delemar RA 99-880]
MSLFLKCALQLWTACCRRFQQESGISILECSSDVPVKIKFKGNLSYERYLDGLKMPLYSPETRVEATEMQIIGLHLDASEAIKRRSTAAPGHAYRPMPSVGTATSGIMSINLNSDDDPTFLWHGENVTDNVSEQRPPGHVLEEDASLEEVKSESIKQENEEETEFVLTQGSSSSSICERTKDMRLSEDRSESENASLSSMGSRKRSRSQSNKEPKKKKRPTRVEFDCDGLQMSKKGESSNETDKVKMARRSSRLQKK